VIERVINPGKRFHAAGFFTMRPFDLLAFLLAIAYGATLSQIPTELYKDFGNYLVYAEHSWPRLQGMLNQGVLTTLANEPVWLLINSIMGSFLEPETVVRTIIFVSGSVVAWLVLRSRPKHFVWLVIFLLFPTVLKNHVIHLRQGAAIAVFVWAWFSPNRVVRAILMASTPFIHASFFFILAVLWSASLMTSARLGPVIRIALFVSLGVALSLGLEWLASAVGARQAQTYEFSMADVSGLGFAFWCSVFALMFMQGRGFLRKYAFETGLIGFYLATYWLIEVTARIFESGLLLVLLAGLSLTGWRRLTYLSAVLAYGGLSWVVRVGQPAMGFGVG